MAGAPPLVKSFLIADQVFQEASGKWYVLGVFTRLRASQFPVLAKSLGLFVILADAEGAFHVRVECCDAADRVVSVFDGIDLTVRSRLDTVHIGFQAHDLTIPAPGKYFFKLHFNGVVVPSEISIVAELRTP